MSFDCKYVMSEYWFKRMAPNFRIMCLKCGSRNGQCFFDVKRTGVFSGEALKSMQFYCPDCGYEKTAYDDSWGDDV